MFILRREINANCFPSPAQGRFGDVHELPSQGVLRTHYANYDLLLEAGGQITFLKCSFFGERLTRIPTSNNNSRNSRNSWTKRDCTRLLLCFLILIYGWLFPTVPKY